MKKYDCHLRTANNMEKYLSELGYGLDGTELMKKAAHALKQNKTIFIPEIGVTLHWIYIGNDQWDLNGKYNSTDVNDYKWKLL